MSGSGNQIDLAHELEFNVGSLRATPSTCRIFSAGSEIRVEAQTMAVLVVLSRAGGATVTRDELIRACWRGRFVTDDAIAQTIAKVRMLARRVNPAPFTLETLPKIGYRLVPAVAVGNAATVEMETQPDPSRFVAVETGSSPEHRQTTRPKWRNAALITAIAAAIPLLWGAFPRDLQASRAVTHSAWDGSDGLRTGQIADALFSLDEPRLRQYLQRGWNPNWFLDSESNDALHTLMLVCERNHTHDQVGLVNIARLLVAAGSDPTIKNKWGDTALIIASATKYCGPDHPVVSYLRSISDGASEAGSRS